METTTPSNNLGQAPQYGAADRLQHSKMLVAIIAVLGVTVAALGAALVVNRSDAQPGPAMAPVAAVTAPAPATAPVAVAAPVVAQAAQAAPAVVAPQPAPNYAVQTVQPKAPVRVVRNDVCASCGSVESVTAVQRQGQVNGVNVGNTTVGIGTVAGGLLGGLLGNQVGGGSGRTAATVLGVAGGAFAGNTVEKNMKKVTVYDVRVRMDNGTYRHLDISSAVPVGSRVIVEGKNLRLANGNG